MKDKLGADSKARRSTGMHYLRKEKLKKNFYDQNRTLLPFEPIKVNLFHVYIFVSSYLSFPCQKLSLTSGVLLVEGLHFPSSESFFYVLQPLIILWVAFNNTAMCLQSHWPNHIQTKTLKTFFFNAVIPFWHWFFTFCTGNNKTEV